MLVYFALSFAILLAINFIVFFTLGNGVLSCILKLFASIAFVLLGIVGFATAESMTYGTSIVGLLFLAGAGFGLVGDGVLALREIDTEKDFMIILSGEIAFAIGHIFYFVALILIAPFSYWSIIIAAVLTAGIFVVAIKLMKLKFGKLLIPSIVYAFMLCSTMVQSIAGAIMLGGSLFSILLAVGFTLFLLSDLVLSMIYFGGQKNKLTTTANYTLYYLAQILIMFAIFFI